MPASPDEAAAFDRARWEEQIEDAFGILLGRPLREFDPKATYALYHEWDMFTEMFFETFEHSTLGSIIPPLPGADEGEYPLNPGRWSLDLGRSIFWLDENIPDGRPALRGWEAAKSALCAVSRDPSSLAVTGADLAPIVAEHSDLLESVWLTVNVRVHTDGTLFDAMRAATWTMGGPADLLTPDLSARAVVEPEWEGKLEPVSDPALRDHLRALCLDAHWARGEGAYYSGIGACPSDLKWHASQPGHAFVTGWMFGEGQGSSAIFAIS
jgi:hypothetical protein